MSGGDSAAGISIGPEQDHAEEELSWTRISTVENSPPKGDH